VEAERFWKRPRVVPKPRLYIGFAKKKTTTIERLRLFAKRRTICANNRQCLLGDVVVEQGLCSCCLTQGENEVIAPGGTKCAQKNKSKIFDNRRLIKIEVIQIKLLFLCSQNKRRSLTAEKIFDGTYEHEVRSAGTETNSRIKVSAGLIGWADIIFCMEKKHVRRIKEKYNDVVGNKKIVCLNISDDYAFMDESLIDILKANVNLYMFLTD